MATAMPIATKEDVLPMGGQSPILQWQEAVAADAPMTAGRLLRDIYRAQVPIWGEIIFTGACDFTCQHCIYPPSFARSNRDLPVEAWLDILEGLNRDLGVGTFVYDGRSVTAAGVVSDDLGCARRRSARDRIRTAGGRHLAAGGA